MEPSVLTNQNSSWILITFVRHGIYSIYSQTSFNSTPSDQFITKMLRFEFILLHNREMIREGVASPRLAVSVVPVHIFPTSCVPIEFNVKLVLKRKKNSNSSIPSQFLLYFFVIFFCQNIK